MEKYVQKFFIVFLILTFLGMISSYILTPEAYFIVGAIGTALVVVSYFGFKAKYPPGSY
jgi:hypothetical protein